MNIDDFIPLQEICTHYEVEVSFVNELGNIGLIQINIFEEKLYIHQDQIRNIEKMIRLHHDLDVNIEGIDIVFNLLQKVADLQEELQLAKIRLKRFGE
jgi:hypothetical protein